MCAALFSSSHHSRPAASGAGGRSAGNPGPRSLLWVDGVGSYLVCLADEVTLGQAAPGNRVAVPILADIGREHCRIRRVGQNYQLLPGGSVRIDEREAGPCEWLRDGQCLELASQVSLRFRRPHPLSSSARLELLHGRRLQPWADAVLLVSETCVLGPRLTSHVVCRDWSADVVLHRRDGGWSVRSSAPLEIDGALREGLSPLDGDSRVVGCDFSFALETLG